MDAVREVRPPFSPSTVVDDFATLLKSYRVSKVVGAASSLRSRSAGSYEVCKQPKSDLFRDMLPLLNAGHITLPRHDRLPAHARDKPIELWWQDEARVSQQGTLTRIWAECGSRPRAPRDQRYDWAYLFGGFPRAMPAPHCAGRRRRHNLHLAEISRNVTLGSHAVVLLDGDGWHQTGGKLKVPDNISLLKLPAYSLELNPVENVWQYLRQNQLSNRPSTATMPSSTPAAMLGIHSPLNQAASNQLQPTRGHQLLSDAVGITPMSPLRPQVRQSSALADRTPPQTRGTRGLDAVLRI